LTLAVVLMLLIAAPAHAAFPGANGKIAVYQGTDFGDGPFEIVTINSDGTGRTNLTNFPGNAPGRPAWSPDGTKIALNGVYVMNADGTNLTRVTDGGSSPTWSPDGTKIAFTAPPNPDEYADVYVANADGTDPVNLTNSPRNESSPAWSPDGATIAFQRPVPIPDYPTNSQFDIFTMNSDGTGETNITQTSASDHAPDWSPDGTKIAFHSFRDGSGFDIYTMNPDGTDQTNLTQNGIFNEFAAWSPDGTKIAFASSRDHGDGDIFVMNADGSSPTNITQNPVDQGSRTPDWQPIPVNAYPRPKGASPQRLSLVPAYEQCTAPNRTHGNPLAFPSCSPPAQSSGQLTLGTPDANGQPAKSVSHVRINPVRGLPSTPADEADVRLRGVIDDVRLASDLSDYTGDLELRLRVQVTDRDNTPHPGGPGPATGQKLTHSHPLPCAATADATVGATCQFDTTVEALVPGAVKELQRAIWELDQVQVNDGAGDPFLRQGVFIP